MGAKSILRELPPLQVYPFHLNRDNTGNSEGMCSWQSAAFSFSLILFLHLWPWTDFPVTGFGLFRHWVLCKPCRS